jgi:hypothetical protein
VTVTLKAHEHPLSKIFSSDYQFTIPDYQRPYRWGVEQADQLLEDLNESFEREVADPYFLGSLVLVDGANNGFDVIDGQQRLTTLTILFAVLRDLANATFADALGALILSPGSVLENLPARPRLDLRHQDRAFFASYVQTSGRIQALVDLPDTKLVNEPQRAIRENARRLYTTLATWPPAKREEFAKFVSTRTYLVVVSTPSLDSAYRIFSVMNARGLDLTPADIFKSQVVGLLPEGSPEAATWDEIADALGTDAFTELFRDIRTIATAERARRELLREFPEQVLDKYVKGTPESAANFVNKIVKPYGDAFTSLASGVIHASPDWSATNAWLRRFGALDNTDWRPAALWALERHRDDQEFLDAFFYRLERLAASMLVRGVYTTPRLARHLELLRQLKRGAGLEAPAFSLGRDERESTMRALDGKVYKLQARRARYLLLRLDEVLSNSSGVEYQHSVLSIEHVLPQNPAPDSQWIRDFSVEEREAWVHRLANLVLLNKRKNSQAGAYDFEKKKLTYFQSRGGVPFALTSQVNATNIWTPATLGMRQTHLLGILSKAWRLDQD